MKSFPQATGASRGLAGGSGAMNVETLRPGAGVAMRRISRLAALCAAPLVAIVAIGCGGSPTAPARDDVFYLHGGGVIDKNYSWEIYFPPLNVDASQRIPKQIGVG